MTYKRVRRIIVMDYDGPAKNIDQQLESRWIKNPEHGPTGNPYLQAHEEITVEEYERDEDL
jgi:hypothetical protein